MPFSPDEIEIKEFVPTLRGYGREEVRAYLRSVSEDVRRLEEQLESAKSLAQSSKPSQVANPAPQAAAAILTTLTANPSDASSTVVLSKADLGLVVDLKDALSELTQAIARLSSTQGLFATSAGAVSAATPSLHDKHVAPVATAEQRSEQASIIKTPSPTPSFATAAKFEPPFIRTKPQTVANSGLVRSGATNWEGIDRRGSERPWKSAQPIQSIEQCEQAAQVGHIPTLAEVPPAIDEFSVSYATAENTNRGLKPTNRDQDNQNLIRAFLGGALGLERNNRPAPREGSLPGPLQESRLNQSLNSRDQAAVDTPEVDNVVALKRAAS